MKEISMLDKKINSQGCQEIQLRKHFFFSVYNVMNFRILLINIATLICNEKIS